MNDVPSAWSADYQHLQVVGYDGGAKPPCGVALPLYQVIGRESYFLGAPEPDQPRTAWVYDRPGLDELVEEGAVTLFETPLRGLREILVVYYTTELAELLGRQMMELVDRKLSWRTADQGAVFIGVGTARDVAAWRNRWAAEALRSACGILAEAEHTISKEALALAAAQAWAGLDLAQETRLRQKGYAVAGAWVDLDAPPAERSRDDQAETGSPKQPSRLQRFYEAVVRVEFPTWDWTAYDGVTRYVRRDPNAVRRELLAKLQEVAQHPAQAAAEFGALETACGQALELLAPPLTEPAWGRSYYVDVRELPEVSFVLLFGRQFGLSDALQDALEMVDGRLYVSLLRLSRPLAALADPGEGEDVDDYAYYRDVLSACPTQATTPAPTRSVQPWEGAPDEPMQEAAS